MIRLTEKWMRETLREHERERFGASPTICALIRRVLRLEREAKVKSRIDKLLREEISRLQIGSVASAQEIKNLRDMVQHGIEERKPHA